VKERGKKERWKRRRRKERKKEEEGVARLRGFAFDIGR